MRFAYLGSVLLGFVCCSNEKNPATADPSSGTSPEPPTGGAPATGGTGGGTGGVAGGTSMGGNATAPTGGDGGLGQGVSGQGGSPGGGPGVGGAGEGGRAPNAGGAGAQGTSGNNAGGQAGEGTPNPTTSGTVGDYDAPVFDDPPNTSDEFASACLCELDEMCLLDFPPTRMNIYRWRCIPYQDWCVVETVLQCGCFPQNICVSLETDYTGSCLQVASQSSPIIVDCGDP